MKMALFELLYNQIVNQELCQLISFEDAIRIYEVMKGSEKSNKFPCEFRFSDREGHLVILKEVNPETIRIYHLIMNRKYLNFVDLFFKAAKEGDLSFIQILLNSGMNVDVLDRDKITPMFIAAFYHHEEIVRLLIEKGANVNTESEQGYTALINAVRSGDLNIASLLLEKGANVNAVNADGSTPLMSAAIGGNIEMAKKLLEYRANVHYINPGGDTALSYAYKYGKREMMKLLIEHGADMDSLQRSYLNRLYDYTYEYTGGIRSALNRLDRMFID